jgi:Mrp family chromosome partitioning ATPase
MKQEAQWILFDCPPVNSYSDSCMISSSADTVVLVVKAGKTRWEAALSALNQLKQWGQNTAGAVLNRKEMAIPDWLYRML